MNKEKNQEVFINKVLFSAKNSINLQSQEILRVSERIDKSFFLAIELLYNAKGKIITCGIGKSGIIAKKISSTLSSLGSPSHFLHPSEAVHGDLGVIKNNDIFLIVSYSGKSEEINMLLPSIKNMKIKIISICGDNKSYLAKHSNYIINSRVNFEACSLGLAPTTSTTSALVIGDAIAISLQELKKFKKEDFANLHPAGKLGRNLKTKVEEIMRTKNRMPKVSQNIKIKDAIIEMSKKGMGMVVIVSNMSVLGIFTDGDLRRFFEESKNLNQEIGEIMNKKPIFIDQETLASEALKKMNKEKISQLIVIDKKKFLIGTIHIHDLINSGF